MDWTYFQKDSKVLTKITCKYYVLIDRSDFDQLL